MNRRAISTLESRARKFILDNGLALAPRPLIIGVSGGPDSLSLLYALHRLSPKLGLDLHVAHFNHGLRGPASDSDAAFVKDQAEGLGLPLSLTKECVKSRPKGHSHSLEEQAREARYNFLARVVHERKALGVAVAHTADDQAETILLHLIRGAGLRGLGGMRPVSGPTSTFGLHFTLFRPLLDVTRAQTEAYCHALGLEPRLDHTNLLPETLRNRVRLELLPQLRQYNPRISDSLLRLAESTSLDLSFIQSQVDEIAPNLVEHFDSGLSISRSKLSDIHPALRRRVLSCALESLYGGPTDVVGAHVTSLESLVTGDTGRELDFPNGIHASLGYYNLVLTGRPILPPSLRSQVQGPPTRESIALPDEPQAIALPGQISIPGWRITATIEEPVSDSRDLGPYTALFDLDRLSGPITVRRRRNGDRFTPLGMSGSKKLQDFLTDAKVPQPHRDSIPIVLSGEKIIWVVEHRPAEHSKITATTRRGLRLQFEKTESDARPGKKSALSLKDGLLAPKPRTENLAPPHR